MFGATFIETLRRTWAQTVLWGLGVGFLGVIVVLMVPLFDINAMIDLLERMPPILLQAAGVGEDLSVIASPEGFIAIGFFSKLVLIYAAYPVIMGLRVTTNDEDEGIMDIVLSMPLDRRLLLVERFAAYLLTTGFLMLMMLGGLWVGVQLVPVALDFGRLAWGIIALMPILVLVLAFTTLMGAIVRQRQRVLAVTTAFIVGSFALQTVGAMAEGTALDTLRMLSFFAYYDVANVIQHGIIWGHVAAVLLVASVLLGGSVVAYQRRDISV